MDEESSINWGVFSNILRILVYIIGNILGARAVYLFILAGILKLQPSTGTIISVVVYFICGLSVYWIWWHLDKQGGRYIYEYFITGITSPILAVLLVLITIKVSVQWFIRKYYRPRIRTFLFYIRYNWDSAVEQLAKADSHDTTLVCWVKGKEYIDVMTVNKALARAVVHCFPGSECKWDLRDNFKDTDVIYHLIRVKSENVLNIEKKVREFCK